jgi:ATP-binding protein involved in chromosome partitioning
LDAVKAIAMFRKVNIPILGMVENMSGFVCPDCGKKYEIFGSGGAKRRAEESQIPFLGEVPIHIQIRESGDAGNAKQSFEDPAVAPYFERLVYQLVKQLSAGAIAQPKMPQLPLL